MDIEGDVTPRFEAVADAFRQNFVAQGEIGAAVAVYHQGRRTVDLAGGSDPLRRRPFTRDSLVMVASCTKGATATCMLMLAEQGLLAVDEKVAAYWPEFAQAGKQDITLRMVLSHRAGLPYPDPGSGLSGLDLVGGPGAGAPARAAGAVVASRQRVRISPRDLGSDPRRGGAPRHRRNDRPMVRRQRRRAAAARVLDRVAGIA